MIFSFFINLEVSLMPPQTQSERMKNNICTFGSADHLNSSCVRSLKSSNLFLYHHRVELKIAGDKNSNVSKVGLSRNVNACLQVCVQPFPCFHIGERLQCCRKTNPGWKVLWVYVSLWRLHALQWSGEKHLPYNKYICINSWPDHV